MRLQRFLPGSDPALNVTQLALELAPLVVGLAPQDAAFLDNVAHELSAPFDREDLVCQVLENGFFELCGREALTRAWFADSNVDHLESSVGDWPNEDERTAASQVLLELVAPVLRREALPRDHLDLLLSMHQKLFGHTPDETWARILAEEIAEEARSRINDSVKQASRPSFAREPPPDGLTLHLRRNPAALEVDPMTPPFLSVHVQPVLVQVSGVTVVYALVGELWGKRQIFAWAIGRFVPFASEPSAPFDSQTAARTALLETVARVATLPGKHSLPEWALDVQLIEILIARMGFDGGGGAARKLTKQRIVNLLAHPAELADELERYGARASTRITDSIERGLSDLVARLRAASNPG